MTVHAKDALRSSSISQVFDLPLAIPTPETGGTESLVPSKDSKVFDLIAARTAAVGAVIAY